MEMTSVLLLAVIIIAAVLQETVANKRVKRIVGGRPAAVPPEDDPVVFVHLNDHDAKVYGTRHRPDGYYNFRGIRYAEPPVGRFRFQRPRKLRLTGVVNATTGGSPCPQPDPHNSGVMGSEDCLFLNVFTPSLPGGSEGLPVLMWIHGGGYRRGSASQYGVRHLVNKKIVVVTIQYRLGSLGEAYYRPFRNENGFLSAGVQELPGNAGLFDMALALEWIKDYIKFFGGAPNKITVFGQGTGASSAVLLSLSQITQGLLNGVLAISGSALSAFAIDHNPLATGRELAKNNGCPETPVLEMVKCLQEMSVSTIIQADSGLQELRLAAQGMLAGITGLLGPAPCIEGSNDGRFLPNFLLESPLDGLRTGNFPNIPFLTGITRDETAPALYGKHKEMVDNFTSSDFLDKFLSALIVKSDIIGRLFNKTDELTQNVAAKYFQFQQDSSAIIKNFAEVSGDALFNLPAFLTAKLWSKHVGKTFFYSFEHVMKQNKHGGSHFLTGLPLVENDGVEGGVGHGDDLPFIFDPEPADDNTSFSGLVLTDLNDQKVQDVVTNVIAEFARTGTPMFLENGEQILWPPFSEEKNNFVTITSKPSLSGNFRFCQMALWSGIFPRLQSATCEKLWGITKFSEDALTVIDHELQQGVRLGGVVSTVINSKLSKNVGRGAVSEALNMTLPSTHSIQIGNGHLIRTFLNRTVPPQNETKVGNGTVIKAMLNETQKEKSGNKMASGVAAPNGTASHGANKTGSQINSSASTQENFVLPVTESNTDTSTARIQNLPGLLPLINKPLINRTMPFPRSGLFPGPVAG